MPAPNRPNATDPWRGIGPARNTRGSRPLLWRQADRALSDPAAYQDSFGQTLDYAAPPHISKHQMALGSDISAKSKAWYWTCEQITAGALRPEWIRRPLTDQVGILFADLFRKIGDCRLPICIGATVAARLFSVWNAITDIRIAEGSRIGRSSFEWVL